MNKYPPIKLEKIYMYICLRERERERERIWNKKQAGKIRFLASNPALEGDRKRSEHAKAIV